LKFSRVIIDGIIQKEGDFNHVSVLSPSFQYGLTVFEGIRIYKLNNDDINIFKLDDHIKRLINSCKSFGFQEIPSFEIIKDDILKLISFQDIKENSYLKYIIGLTGEGTWQSRTDIKRIAFYYPLKSYLPCKAPLEVHASISKIIKTPSSSLPAKIKCGANYINSRHAFFDVNKESSEMKIPILLDHNNFITETSGSTIFITLGNKVITPSLNYPILDSITRRFILNTISIYHEEFNFIEKEISINDLLSAEEIFFAGTNAEITSVKSINNKNLSKSRPITNGIFKTMFELIYKENDIK